MGRIIKGGEIFFGNQHTISQELELFGQGLMTGRQCSVVLRPLPENSGIVFRVSGEDVKLSLNTTFVGFHNLCLKTAGSHLMYIEHLLSVLFGFGVDNVLVEVEGPEIPFFDGSGLVFSERLLQVGLKEQEEIKRYGLIVQECEVSEGDSYIRAVPSGDFSIHAEYVSPTGRVEEFFFDLETEFADELSPARTFIYEDNLKTALDTGLFRGGNLDSAIIFNGDEPLNTILRFQNERVRHKVLDLLGDMFSIGLRLVGRFYVRSPSHELTRRFLSKLKYVVL